MANNDINKKLEELLKDINPSVLKTGKQNIEQLIKSRQGQKIVDKLSDADKEKIVGQFMKMSNDEIRSKLKNVKMSDLSKISADDILKRLK